MKSESCIRVYADHQQIRRCREKLKVGEDTLTQLAGILALTGNDVRLKILYLLEEEGELCPCDISDILGMTVPAVSQHLRKMKDGNIVQFRKQSQTVYYSLKPEHVKVLRPFFRYIQQNSEKETA